MRVDRRRFLAGLVAAAAARPRHARASRHAGFGPLRPDPNRLLDLPDGFRYDVIAQRGDEMDDGLVVPGRADGMAAFPGDDGTIVLVCNHENMTGVAGSGPFGDRLGRIDRVAARSIYDRGNGRTPSIGGTTTITWDPRGRRRLRQHMSLLGTEVNCAGGATPWGSWLSCEECFIDRGSAFAGGGIVTHDKRHGYVFEVPSRSLVPAAPRPIRAMGRFEHEAAAVDPATGIVYLSEDKFRSLLYRYVPDLPGKLAEGGRLQALAVRGRPGYDTRNWGPTQTLAPGERLAVEWLDLRRVDGDENDLRLRGHAQGAALFARGEGLCFAGGELFLTCTAGGAVRLGQVFALQPGGGEDGADALRLVVESDSDSLLQHADNLCYSPWGDLVVCEDTVDHCGLVGVRPDGAQYPIADNAYSVSELAGVCFAPDGQTLFVNIQEPGTTLAISGPWERLGA